jgi:hypothetical protein
MANRKAIIETNKGTITSELYEDKAPITSANFVDLIERGFITVSSFIATSPALLFKAAIREATARETLPIRRPAANAR